MWRCSVPERPRLRSSGTPGAVAVADGLELPDPFASRGHGGQAMHPAFFPDGGGWGATIWTVRTWTFSWSTWMEVLRRSQQIHT